MPKFTPVKPSRFSDTIAAQLKNAILIRDYKPDEKLPSEKELTETFQASRVVVREAIRSLELGGFVSIRQGPYGGAYVRRLGYDRLTEHFIDLFMAGELSVQELVQARLFLETEVVCLAAQNITDEWAEKLRKALAEEQIPTKKHADWVRRNMATDYILMEMCGNRFYAAMLEPLMKLTQEIVLVVKPRRTVIHDPREHQAIVDAIINGNCELAAQAMANHIRNMAERLINLEGDYRKRKGLV